MYNKCEYLSIIRVASRPPKEKPAVVAEYNKYMLGVDKLDQLASYYNFKHKSVKWWRKVFFWLVEVAIVNSCHLQGGNAKQKRKANYTSSIPTFASSIIDREHKKLLT